MGLFFLTFVIFAGVVLTQQNIGLNIKASPTCQPVNPQVSNITHTSADVSFLTESVCSIALKIDNRTITNFKENSKVHYFQVNNLKESTQYTYSFVINAKEIQNDNYRFKTANRPSGKMPTSNLAWGKVYTAGYNPAADAVVYLNIPGASPLSSLVTSNGYWNISLATSFNMDKNSWFTPPDNVEEEIIVLFPGFSPTQITSNTSKNNPVPDIIIGQNSFSKIQIDELASGILLPESGGIPSIQLDVLNPKDNESINTQKPDIFGSAPPGSELDILIESPQSYNGKTTASTNGSWNWSPPANLEPGEHTITVTATDPKTGAIQTIKRKFIVMAAEDNTLAFTASGSAVQPSPTPTLKPSPTTAVATPIPTSVPTTKINTPTSIPVTKTESPSTDSGIPVAGTTLPTLALILFASCLLGLAHTISKKSGI